MIRAALIVEGKGDVSSIPGLVAKIAAAFNIFLIPSDPPIKSGEALKLKRPGELERYLYLAASRDEVDAVYLIVDLDDGCPKEYSIEFSNRAAPIQQQLGKPIHICFIVREYEVLFLNDLANLKSAMPELGIQENVEISNPHLIRGAKEKFRDICKGKIYKQSRDQGPITKKLNVFNLIMTDRSFRKLAKCITNMDYEELIALSRDSASSS